MPDDRATSSKAPLPLASTPAATPQPPTLYPAFCWPASPTYNAWVKMSAADVRQLRRERAFEAYPRTWFYKNHPVRFIRLVGLITSWTPADSPLHLHDSHTPLHQQHSHQQRPHVFTLDDGSGASLDIVIWPRDRAELAQNIARYPGDLIQMGPLDFKQHVGRSVSGDLVDLSCVSLGATVKVKGWVAEYRGEKQILLERVQRLGDGGGGGETAPAADETMLEVKEWERLAEFQTRVLAKPWVLSKEEVDRLRARERRARIRRETRRAEKRAVDALDPSFRQDQEAAHDAAPAEEREVRHKIHVVKKAKVAV